MQYTKVTAESVSLKWDKYQNLGPSQFVEYRLKIQKKLSNAESPVIKTSSKTSYEVTGLESATLYDVQVSVKTVDFGESEYTEATSFKTSSLSDSDKSEVDKLVDTVVCQKTKFENIKETYKYLVRNKKFSTLQNENKDSLQKLITDVKNSLNDEIVSTYITYLLTLEYIKISMYDKHCLFSE